MDYVTLFLLFRINIFVKMSKLFFKKAMALKYEQLHNYITFISQKNIVLIKIH